MLSIKTFNDYNNDVAVCSSYNQPVADDDVVFKCWLLQQKNHTKADNNILKATTNIKTNVKPNHQK